MADYTFKRGATDRRIFATFDNPSDEIVAAWYIRDGGSLVTLVVGTEHASDGAAHVDNKWRLVVDDLDGIGLCVFRYDLPDAVVSEGVAHARVFLAAAESGITEIKIDIVGYDPELGILLDINDEAVPPIRTWTLFDKGDADGLTGDRRLYGHVGTEPTFAIDFRNDLKANGRVVSVESIEIVDGEEDGVTFPTNGREDSQAKVKFVIATAGVYSIACEVTYHNGDTQKGVVEFEAIEA